MKFIFYTPHFDENNGGVIAIFKLADLLNQHGHIAKIWHWTRMHDNEVRLINGKVPTQFVIPNNISRIDIGCPYTISEASKEDIFDSVVIYPEIIEGNPLGAKKVVRWLLNKPGAINGCTSFGFGDLIFHYADHFLPDGYIAEEKFSLKITDFKIDTYLNNHTHERHGEFYMIRKGHDVPHTYHHSSAVNIDGKSHVELSQIFSSAKTFISYDLHTAYSLFASMAGCDSIVVPRPGMTIDQWRTGKDKSDIHGVAYGFEDIQRARNTRHLMIEKIFQSENMNIKSMNNFIDLCSRY